MKTVITPEMVDKIVELREEGVFARDIANQVGCSRKSVYRKLEERGAI